MGSLFPSDYWTELFYENRNSSFVKIKRELLLFFSNTFHYNGKDMYPSIIISDYTEKVIQALNQPEKGVLSLDMSYRYMRMILTFDMPIGYHLKRRTKNEGYTNPGQGHGSGEPG